MANGDNDTSKASPKTNGNGSITYKGLTISGTLIIAVLYALLRFFPATSAAQVKENSECIDKNTERIEALEKTVESYCAAQAERDKYIHEAVTEIKDDLKELRKELK